MNRSELVNLLEKYNIPLAKWGVGEAKTVDHLLKEINSGETTLSEENGVLYRITSTGSAIVHHKSAHGPLLLVEEKQVFKDGRVRTRILETSVSEKMKPGESPEDATHRALAEELGITEKLPLTPLPTIIKGPTDSQSYPGYPGLSTLYKIYVFEVIIPDHLFKPEGYTEKQADKTTYFVWTNAENSS